MRRIAGDTQVTPDSNVLIAAFRKDHAHYAVARVWFRAAVASGAEWRLLGLGRLPVLIA